MSDYGAMAEYVKELERVSRPLGRSEDEPLLDWVRRVGHELVDRQALVRQLDANLSANIERCSELLEENRRLADRVEIMELARAMFGEGAKACIAEIPIVCIGARGMLEHEHADHPDYKFPVEVERVPPIRDCVEWGPDREPHALIYTDGSIALTMYECSYSLWSLFDGRWLGGSLWDKRWRLTEESRRQALEFFKRRTDPVWQAFENAPEGPSLTDQQKQRRQEALGEIARGEYERPKSTDDVGALKASVEKLRARCEARGKDIVAMLAALEFYGNEENWGRHGTFYGGSDGKWDDGAMARATIKGLVGGDETEAQPCGEVSGLCQDTPGVTRAEPCGSRCDFGCCRCEKPMGHDGDCRCYLGNIWKSVRGAHASEVG